MSDPVLASWRRRRSRLRRPVRRRSRLAIRSLRPCIRSSGLHSRYHITSVGRFQPAPRLVVSLGKGPPGNVGKEHSHVGRDPEDEASRDGDQISRALQARGPQDGYPSARRQAHSRTTRAPEPTRLRGSQAPRRRQRIRSFGGGLEARSDVRAEPRRREQPEGPGASGALSRSGVQRARKSTSSASSRPREARWSSIRSSDAAMRATVAAGPVPSSSTRAPAAPAAAGRGRSLPGSRTAQ